MKRIPCPSKDEILKLLKTQWPQIFLILLVFMVFLGNVIGFINFNTHSPPWFSFRTSLFFDTAGFLGLPAIVKSSEFISLLIIGILLSLILPVLKPIPASALAGLCTIPPFYINAANPGRQMLVPMEYSLLIILLLFGVNVLFNYFNEIRNKQKIINIFGQFVPPEIVNQMSLQPELINLEGESRHLTVFFCDLKNFSGVSEQLNPKQLVMLLNEYFTAMTTILHKHGATIDKYIGDSIMAFWGAPLPQKDHARRSVMAAFEMHDEIERLSKQFILRGWPGPTMGVGINSGFVNVGNMGSKFRVAYTVVGDAVNLASRLQSMTRTYHVPTIVGEETARSIDDIVFRELDTVLARGKRKKTRIYQPLFMKDQLNKEMESTLKQHHKAIDCYYLKQYEQAIKLFTGLLESSKDDPYYQHMLEKISTEQKKM